MSTGLSSAARIAILLRRRVGSQREDRAFDTIVRRKHFQIVAFSMVGLVTMAITQLVVWSIESNPSQGVLRDAYYDSDITSDQSGPTLVNILYLSQAVLSWSTIVTCALVAQKYRLLLMQKRAEWAGTSLMEAESLRGDNVASSQDRVRFLTSYSFWGSPMKWWFLLEMAIQLPHPILWMNTAQSISSPMNIGFKLLQVNMVLRLVFLPNVLHLMSPAYIKRFEIVNRSRELLSVGFKFRPSLTLKIYFFQKTASTLVRLMVTSVIVFGFCQWTLSRVEGRFDPLVSDGGLGILWNDIWFSYVAYATIGFGDYFPTNAFGRVVSVLTTLTGSLIFVLFAGVIVNRVSLTKEQRYGVEYLLTRRADEMYRDAAMRLRDDFLRMSLEKMRDEKAGNVDAIADSRLRRLGHKGNRIYRDIRRFRAARQELESSFMQAEDIVVNEKLAAIDLISNALRIDVEKYSKDIAQFEDSVQMKLRQISDRVNRYVSRGHVAV